MSTHTRLFVGNIPGNCDEKSLQNVFADFGTIKNIDVKTKENDSNKQKFAFVTLDASNYNVETCIKHFNSNDFNGHRLYVTRARESFLERLQREREQTQKPEQKSNEQVAPQSNPVINLGASLNPRKRRTDHKVQVNGINGTHHVDSNIEFEQKPKKPVPLSEAEQKKLDSEKKRLESMNKKRQDFKQKQMTIRSALVGIDKVQNNKIIFSDPEDDKIVKQSLNTDKTEENRAFKNKSLFDEDDDVDDNINFEIKEQYEGRKGQKILELQSRYKSDSRFVLDERFVDDDDEGQPEADEVEVGQEDEKIKQLNILQDVLGVAIKSRITETQNLKDNKKKTKLGMLRFDPTQPEHAKFLAPPSVAPLQDGKKKKQKAAAQDEVKVDEPTIEVSKDQFYSISDSFRESIAQPTNFTLRSVFGTEDEPEEEKVVETYEPLEKKKEVKVKNPLDPTDKNPFKYDSSDSEDDEEGKKKAKEIPQEIKETKPFTLKEQFFFTKFDKRLIEGLEFFNEKCLNEDRKDRRELKTLIKKRLYNKQRKDQMFKKKIGGKRFSKKTFNKKRN